MLIVKVTKRDGINRALKILKNKFHNTGLKDELRERKEYKKPSVKRREKKQKAIYVEEKYGNNED